MNSITAPINSGDRGVAVVNLQEALIFLLTKVPDQLDFRDAASAAAFARKIAKEKTRATFEEATKDALLRLQKSAHIEISGVVDDRTAQLLNSLLEGLGAFGDADDAQSYTVEGTVSSPDRAGVGGLQVLIVDKNAGPDVKVAEASTDDHGHYTATFPAILIPEGKAQPDVQARVQVDGVFLAASDIHYNASRRETLDVLLPGNATVLPSEHETLTGALAAHFTGKLGDLKEDDDRQDITYLANKTGWDARTVAMAALADQFSQQTVSGSTTGIAAPFHYALFRAGLPADPDVLYQTDTATVGRVWKQAIDQGVIPAAMAQQTDGALKTFQQLSAEKLLTAPALVGASSVKEMLKVSGINERDPRQRQFAELYTAHGTDLPKFWAAVTAAFGEPTSKRLQVDGKLGYLTLNNAPLMQALHKDIDATNGVTDPLQLAQVGYHKADKWMNLLNAPGIVIPKEIPGTNDTEKQSNYAAYQAAKVRLSYPTACVAQLIKSRELQLTQTPADTIHDDVHAFLSDHQGKFEIGIQPVEQYVIKNKLTLSDAEKIAVGHIKRVERVYQITPSDEAMKALLKNGIDAAYHVVRHDREAFIQTYKDDLGGALDSAKIYDRAVQVHNAVLNIVMGYFTARTAPAIGVHSPARYIDPVATDMQAANAKDVIAYPALEQLFGSMDFCACDHCRSILSPAAYLVDLLQFLGSDEDVWKTFTTTWKAKYQCEYPFTDTTSWNAAGKPGPEISPFDVLMSRRPDIQHIPLTCENTNTPLPYIDVVNEILEYFIVNKLSLNEDSVQQQKEYQGHDTGSTASEDLLANPQYVMDNAYETLSKESFRAPLPFHQPLESLRRYFNKFQVSLPFAMEALRRSDDLEGGDNAYGWRDIWMEELRLSRDEYNLLTISTPSPNTLAEIYGFVGGTSDDAAIVTLSNPKRFCRRMDITYDDLVAILQTRFVNPNSDLIPKLEQLGISFANMKTLKDKGPAGDADFDKLVHEAGDPDPAEFGGDIKSWVRKDDNYKRIMGIILLTVPAWAANRAYLVGDCVTPTVPGNSTLYYECTKAGISGATEPSPWPTKSGDSGPAGTVSNGTTTWTCRDGLSSSDFGSLAFRHSDPAKMPDPIDAVEFGRMLRFVRLWKKLGWTIEQTDAAICSLLPVPAFPLGGDAIDSVAKLDTGFSALLPRLGIAVRVLNMLKVSVKRALESVLALSSDIGTHGPSSLYRRMFLNLAVLKQDPIFDDDGYGNFLDRPQVPHLHPTDTLDSAILAAAPGIGYDPRNRRLFFQGALKSTDRDAVKAVAGVTAEFKAAVDALFASQYLVTHTEALRGAFNLTDQEFSQITTDLRLSTLVSVPYDQSQPTLDQVILDTVPALRYDDANKLLSYPGVLSEAQRDNLIALPGVSVAFTTAAKDLFTANSGSLTALVSVPYAQPLPTLDASVLNIVPTLSYDQAAKRLSFPGVLSEEQRDALIALPGVSEEFKIAVRNLFALNSGPLTTLTLDTLSAIYRRAWLARALKISVQELLMLSRLTGLDPFSVPDPTAPAILRFIALVQAMNDRSFKPTTALYLIWNQDLSGKAAPPTQVMEFARTLRADFAAIDDQFSASSDPGGDAFRNQMTLVYGQEVADVFFSLLDESLPLTVVYTHDPSDVTITSGQTVLLAEITSTDRRISYEVLRHVLSHSGVLTKAKRDALQAIATVSQGFKDAVQSLFDRSEDIQGSFFTRHQELEPLLAIHRSDSIKGFLAGRPELSPLYDNFIPLDTKEFKVPYVDPTGILDPAISAIDSTFAYNNSEHTLSRIGLFSSDLRDKLKGVKDVPLDFQIALDSLFASVEGARREALLGSFRPELARRRKRDQALQRLSSAANLDLLSTTALIDATHGQVLPLHASANNDRPALDDVVALETPGLAVHFSPVDPTNENVRAAAKLDYSGDNPLPPNATTAGKPISGTWTGRVETPEPGFYNFVIEADSGATASLKIGGQLCPLTSQSGTVYRNLKPMELKGGSLYELELKVDNISKLLKFKWETPKRAREVIPARYLYPPSIFAPFSEAYTRFFKVISLATGLGLTANEMAHFATRADYWIDARTGKLDANKGDPWLNHLANRADAAVANTLNQTLLIPFRAILDFARIKAQLSPGDESLLNILQHTLVATKDSQSLLYTLTRWDKESLNVLLAHFGGDIAGLARFDLLRRVYDAFALVQTLGIPAGALIGATTNHPDGETVRDLQAALRARYDAESWREIVRPINDEMRDLQRDALVTYILHQLRASSVTDQIDTADKLFEYFLTDVQMEPCMETSRIRHALSSVQLFIDRCLMNLEPRVSPAAINATQWEWMKRYRVWEANRKVFLWPENWLEPELRDDKSSFCKETESELLQTDITEDSAAVACLNYLSKLEEVAKLEPCGIFHEEGSEAERKPDIDHVIARTAGAHRKYYYRRNEAGSWTPWEQIKLDIEDNPVIPVVWNNRLFLFWLRILKQVPMNPPSPPPPSTYLSNLDAASVIKSDVPKVTVQVVLCWSEYYNGKWQLTKTSDVNWPSKLSQQHRAQAFDLSGPNAFDRMTLSLLVLESPASLRVAVQSPQANTWFVLYNTHSLPVPKETHRTDDASQYQLQSPYRSQLIVGDIYSFVYRKPDSKDMPRQILNSKKHLQATIIEPNPTYALWTAPFFFADSHHVFYINTEEEPVSIALSESYGASVSQSDQRTTTIPPLILQAVPNLLIGPKFWGDGGPADPASAGIKQQMQQFVTEDAYTYHGIATTEIVTYGGRQIGPSGSNAKIQDMIQR